MVIEKHEFEYTLTRSSQWPSNYRITVVAGKINRKVKETDLKLYLKINAGNYLHSQSLKKLLNYSKIFQVLFWILKHGQGWHFKNYNKNNSLYL